ncbi:MAG: hypothetical protein FJZ47_20210 [Candidatus Tectomicrobia bacterium]|uniref:histidine kinase n=1 Tax=Tectimicrobiota bacterium TaxID=2528274 RepID=A0A937W373_UNCTE|nr:hypothetical protein [Candidatus Tectomicrobia bacterium]
MHLPTLALEVLTLVQATLPGTITVLSHLDDTVGMVLADPAQLYQVGLHLCTNAVQSMRYTGGLLEISVNALTLSRTVAPPLPALPPGRYVQLIVHDTGHGMPPEILARIFDPFFTTKEVGEGTGLGLAVVHGIVNSHDGAIQVESTPGQGTTFTVYLPQMPATVQEDSAWHASY